MKSNMISRELCSPSHFLPRALSFQSPATNPSECTHCFETIYSSDYNKGKHHRIKSHHPELEPPLFNPTAQSCYTIDCRPPYGSIFFACVQHSEKEQEGCRKSNRDGENLQTMPSEKQEACLLAVLQGYPSSKKTCHTLKPNSHLQNKEVTSEKNSQLGIRRMEDLIRNGLRLGEAGSSSDSCRCSPKIWSKIRLGANQDNRGLRIRGL
ncbi:hypothetical protein QYF61_025038 [Mycteria americana]|uniref:Uncharacterized protein n=1 Tax=Mycteria americana TaxID=33587 RepID=A0AAN7MM38_MYCAM|nr:hypothetical protein QYF61_025038 [Mycteria americana]